jgi:HEPN domain-containing protein
MRGAEQVIWEFVKQWLAKAEADLETARVLLKPQMQDYFTCAFHCQQAAEKFLKA